MSIQQGQLIPGTLPDICWPSDPQIFYNQICQITAVQFPGLTGVIISDAQPAATDRDKAWLKTSGGAPLWPLVYIYFNAVWISRHPVPPGASERRMWVGAETDLPLYDGGDGLAAGASSGPMWVVDHAFDARFPLAPGTLPSGLAVAVGNTGGEEKHQLTLAELAAHTHPPLLNTPPYGFVSAVPSGGSASTQGGTVERVDATTGSAGGDTAHNNMPPYMGCFLIMRSPRVYYRGA